MKLSETLILKPQLNKLGEGPSSRLQVKVKPFIIITYTC